MKYFVHHRVVLLLSLILCARFAFGQDADQMHFRNIVKQDLGLAQNASIRDIVQDRHGFVWLATGKGLYRYDGHEFKGYYPIAGDSTSISDTEIMCLHYSDTFHKLWIGTALHGIDCYSFLHDSFERIGAFPDSLGRIWCISPDKNGILWIGADYALISIREDTYSCTAYRNEYDAMDDPRMIIRTIIPDQREGDLIWLGTHRGLIQFDKTSGSFTREIMPFDTQYDITECERLSSGDFWCTSYYGGLLHFDPVTREWFQFDMPEDLRARPGGRYNVIYSLALATDTTIWFTAFDGVGTFDIPSGRFQMFEKSTTNPLWLYPSDSYRSLCISSTELIFIGGSDILSIAYAARIPTLLRHAPVIISASTGSHDWLNDTAGMYLRHLVLDEQEIDLNIELTAPEFVIPVRVRYRYLLEGYDADWIEAGAGRLARYTNMTRGEYTFRYRASVDGINWIDGLPIRVVKKISFWKTSWFLLLGVVFVGAVIWAINTMRIRRFRIEAKRQAAFEKQLAEVEMTALRAQMNPHFIFNALSSIKYFILENEVESANSYLTKFSQLIRAVLKNSKSRLVLLADEIQALRLYIELEAVRFIERFEYSIEIDPVIDMEHVLIAPLLIQPYVENAIWHGLLQKQGPGRLSVRILKQNSFLHIEIEDNGVGRAKAKELKSKIAPEKKSLGMQITRDRIELIRQSMGIDSTVTIEDLSDNGHATGTRVVVRIPYLLKSPPGSPHSDKTFPA